jgi:hypothetical protein
MVPITPHGPMSPQHPVHGLRRTNREPLAAAREAHPTLGLHEEMDVVGLHAPVQDAEGPLRGSGEGLAHWAENASLAKRGDATGGTEGDVHRDVAIMGRATAVRHGTATWRRRPTRAPPMAAPRAEDKAALQRLGHLESGIDYIKLAGKSTTAAIERPE